jgi:ribosomal protein L29
MPAPPVHIQVEHLKELRKELRRLADDELKKTLRDLNKDVADQIVAEALPHVPVRTGKLRSNVRALASQSAAYGKAGGARLPYAAAIHWGEGSGNVNHTTGATVGRPNRNIQGRPFLWDAIDQYEEELDKMLDQVRAR